MSRNGNYVFVLLSICLLLAGSLGVFPVNSAEAVEETELSNQTPSWTIKLAFSDLPLLNKQVTLRLEATYSEDAPNTTLRIFLPETLRLVSGDVYWTGDICINEWVQIEAVVEVVAIGDFTVEGWAFNSFMGESSGGISIIEVMVTETDATVTQVDPHPTTEGVQLTPMTVIPGLGNSITVEGKFWFVLNRTVYTPVGIGGAEFEVFDEEVDYFTGLHLPWPDEKVASGTTNEDGSFSIVVPNNDDGWLEGGRDLYVVVYARNFVCDVVNNPWFLGGGTFSFKTGVYKNSQDHNYVNFGDYTCAPEQDFAWDIFTTLQPGYWFLNSETGLSNPQVRAFYADFFTSDSSYYLNSLYSDTAWLISMVTSMIPPELDWLGRDLVVGGLVGVHYDAGLSVESKTRRHEVILHEYGHYVMDLYGESHPPDTVKDHYYDVAYTPEHAWVEGWAEFFSAAARQWWGAPKSEWNSPPVEPNYKGDSVEGAVTGVLWDIYDSEDEIPINGEGRDVLSMGFDPIWDVFRHYDPDLIMGWPLGANHPWNIYDFWDGFRTRQAGSPASGLWQILKLHGIDPGIEDFDPPTNPNAYTSSIPIQEWHNVEVITISWSGATDALSGVATYAWKWDKNPNGVPSETIFCAGSHACSTTSSTSMSTQHPDFLRTTNFLNFLGEGNSWYFHVQAVDGAGNKAEGAFTVGPFYIGDQTHPQTCLDVIGKKEIGQDSFIGIDNTLTLQSMNFLGDKNVGSVFYIIKSDTYDSGPKSYTETGAFSLNGLVDGRYTIQYYSEIFGYRELVNTLFLVLDTTPAATILSIGEPKYVVNPTFVTSDTPFAFKANDGEGSGVASIYYRIYKAGYDTGWVTYEDPFRLMGLPDGEYSIDYYSIDNMDNIEATGSAVFLLDNTAPILTGLSPTPGVALQDGIVFQFNLVDYGSGVSSVRFLIQTSSGVQVSGNLEATYDPVSGIWVSSFGTLQLPDGYYTLMMEIKDRLGNGAPEMVQYSVRNWAVLQLLPQTANSKAGRTMPIKFSLRVDSAVDPLQPFVYSEDLAIKVFETGNPGVLLQVSTFGSASRDYRIDATTQKYVTNFKTKPQSKSYTAEIYRGTLLLGSLTFSTTK